MHLVEMPDGAGQLGQHDGAVAAVHAADVIAFKRVHEALGHVFRLRAVDRRVHRLDAQFMSQGVRLDCPESDAVVAQEFQGNCRSSVLPKRASTASIIMSRTDSPGDLRPIQVRQAVISRSQPSFMKMPVTTPPLSQAISKPSEHQRWFDCSTATLPS